MIQFHIVHIICHTKAKYAYLQVNEDIAVFLHDQIPNIKTPLAYA